MLDLTQVKKTLVEETWFDVQGVCFAGLILQSDRPGLNINLSASYWFVLNRLFKPNKAYDIYFGKLS